MEGLGAIVVGKPLDDHNCGYERGATAELDANLRGRGWEDEKEALTLDERREARHGKRHKEQAKRLPRVCGLRAGAATDTEQQRNADDQANAKRVEPDRGRRIEVPDDSRQVPNEIAPKRDLASGQAREEL